ncbi:hypothetical protein N9A58_09665 [Opitutales bacterium]|nr:hypothetical protein [Opitutales bacterium]
MSKNFVLNLMGKYSTMQKRLLPLCLLALVSLASSSCGLNPKKYFSKKVNLAGVVTHEPSSFAPIETGTFRVSSDELVDRRLHQGGKTTLLWGLFTYTDY